MSFTIIEDGLGKGNKAEVDNHGRLSTKAVHVSHLSHHSTYHKNTYMAIFNTTLAGTSETDCAFLYNDSTDKDIEIYFISVSCTANCELISKVGNTYTSGGVATVPVNTNLSSVAVSPALLYEGGVSADLVLASTLEREFCGAYLGSHRPLRFDYEGAVVLSPKSGITFAIVGAASDKVKVSVAYSLHNEGTRL